MPDEIVVDIEVPFLVAVHHTLFADLDFLDEPHHRDRHRVDLQNVLVRRALSVAEGRIAAHIFPGLEGGQLHRLDLVAGVPRIEVIHDIFQNDQHFIVLADGVHPIVEGNEPASEGRENEVGIFARFDVITA